MQKESEKTPNKTINKQTKKKKKKKKKKQKQQKQTKMNNLLTLTFRVAGD